MNLTTYNLVFRLLKPFAKLYFKKRSKKDPRYGLHLAERFYGEYSLENAQIKIFKQYGTIHIHAASLGEVNLISNFVKSIINLQLEQNINSNFSFSPIVITTNTPTGRQAGITLARNCQDIIERSLEKTLDSLNSTISNHYQQFHELWLKIHSWITVVYLPLELNQAIDNFNNAFNPKITYLVETEIWSLFIHKSAQHHPINIINGRLSNKYYKYYSKNPIKSSLKQLSTIVTQSASDKFMYLSLLYNLNLNQMQTYWQNFNDLHANQQNDLSDQTNKHNQQLDLNNLIDQYFLDNLTNDNTKPLITKVVIGNNLKYCKELDFKQIYLQSQIKQYLQVQQKTKIVLLITSTYPNELTFICKVLEQFKLLDKLQIVIAPRHLENFAKIEQVLQPYTNKILKFSQFKTKFDCKLTEFKQACDKYIANDTNINSESSDEVNSDANNNIDLNSYTVNLDNTDSNFNGQNTVVNSQVYELFIEIRNLFSNTQHCSDKTEANNPNDDQLFISKNCDIVIVDTIGDLTKLYSLADICLIGGTFNEIGGHDVLEAIGNQVPVIVGPNYKSQHVIVDDFSKLQAITKISSELKLNSSCLRQNLASNLLQDQPAIQTLGKILENLAQHDSKSQDILMHKSMLAFNHYVANQQALKNHLTYLNLYND